MKGHHTKRAKKRMSDAQKKRFEDPKERRKIKVASERRYKEHPESHGMLNKHHSKKTIRRMEVAQNKRFENPKERRKMARYGNSHADMKQLWQDPSYARKVLSSNSKRPNGREREVRSIINSLVVAFRYVGDGRVMVDGRNPDFIRADGIKQVIEFFGNHWHEKKEVSQRKRHYERSGYDCLVIWERELKDVEKLKKKILNFTTNMEIKMKKSKKAKKAKKGFTAKMARKVVKEIVKAVKSAAKILRKSGRKTQYEGLLGFQKDIGSLCGKVKPAKAEKKSKKVKKAKKSKKSKKNSK